MVELSTKQPQRPLSSCRGLIRVGLSMVLSLTVLESLEPRMLVLAGNGDDYYNAQFDDDVNQSYQGSSSSSNRWWNRNNNDDYSSSSSSSSNNNNNNYNYGGNNNNNNNGYNNNYNNNNGYNNNGYGNRYNNNGDDYYSQNSYSNSNKYGDDYNDRNYYGDDYYSSQQGDDGYKYEQQQYQNVDDDTFHWNRNVGFDGVSAMPISCINYNNGHMIKFQLFDSANSYQCHFAEISTFVVSISHYMRAYFNYQALQNGKDFKLPSDAGYLNCQELSTKTSSGTVLYGKIGCMSRETFTSTRLQLHVYTDEQCTQSYDDGQSDRKHANRGYFANGAWISSKVSFKPPFYSCLTCTPDQISGTFNKKNSNWYDDDYIAEHGVAQNQQNGAQQDDNADDGYDDQDDYFDDAYLEANDDMAVDDDAKYNYYNNNNNNDDGNAGDDYYNYGDDQQVDDGYSESGNDDANNYNNANYYNNNANNNYYNANYYNNGGNRKLEIVKPLSKGLEAYKKQFWQEYSEMKDRMLYDNYYDIGEWNMCQRIYKYGVWCDEECRSLDFFRTDQWSASDIFLLAIMVTFLSAMMLLVVAKRLKAQQKARIYGEHQPMPGLPPFAMAIIFTVIMAVLITLAKFKFINETLVFAVVTCILLFIYMLKLTLFENRRPVLLAAPRHDMFDNPLDDHLFD